MIALRSCLSWNSRRLGLPHWLWEEQLSLKDAGDPYGLPISEVDIENAFVTKSTAGQIALRPGGTQRMGKNHGKEANALQEVISKQSKELTKLRGIAMDLCLSRWPRRLELQGGQISSTSFEENEKAADTADQWRISWSVYWLDYVTILI